MTRWCRKFASVIVLATAIAGCDEEKPKFTLKEVIDVQGVCSEDHVGRQEHYAGQIVRWQSVETGAISTYGFLSKPFSADAALEEATQATAYHTPTMISLLKIDIDTSQPKWVLHGVSDRGETDDGYDFDMLA